MCGPMGYSTCACKRLHMCMVRAPASRYEHGSDNLAEPVGMLQALNAIQLQEFSAHCAVQQYVCCRSRGAMPLLAASEDTVMINYWQRLP
jgi:hypothetical protein